MKTYKITKEQLDYIIKCSVEFGTMTSHWSRNDVAMVKALDEKITKLTDEILCDGNLVEEV